ncbi:MAG: CBS domain-containing protein [Nitrosopumilus sp.]|nr:CBS domain-containing protein [Nitrosopumilus sp.]MDH3502175.1 CBS domain-containing protein [Nitrosopumilus sp.]
MVEAKRKMIELGVDSILVLRDNLISGIVTQADIMKAISKEVRVSDTVESIMSKPLITIGNVANVGQAIKMMKENKIRRLVVKKDSDIIGTITQKKIFGVILAKHLRFLSWKCLNILNVHIVHHCF